MTVTWLDRSQYQQLPLLPDIEPPLFSKRVYFGLGANGQIKIGLTGRPSGRRGGEMHFSELCSVPGDRLVEAGYHRRYADCRIGKTEWFRPTDRLLLDLLMMCREHDQGASAGVLYDMILRRMPSAA